MATTVYLETRFFLNHRRICSLISLTSFLEDFLQTYAHAKKPYFVQENNN